MKQIIISTALGLALAACSQAANVASSVNGGVADYMGTSTDTNWGFHVSEANDGDYGTMNHTDAGPGNILRITFDAIYDLQTITVYNRDGIAGGSEANADRLLGATVQAWTSGGVQIGATSVVGSIVDTTLGSVHTFDNGGAGYAGASYITLSSDNDMHVLEFEAEAVPEPSSAALLGLGGLALILRRRK